LDDLSAFPIIYAGTVDSVEYALFMERAPITRVRFSHLDPITSWGGGTVTLTLSGGLAWPRFEKGSRWIVFAHNLGDEPWFMPFAPETVFKIQASRRDSVVYAMEGPLVEIASGLLGVLYKLYGATDSTMTEPADFGEKSRPSIRYYPERGDPGTRVTEAEFLETVRNLREGN
jgi:hypothetical protein